MNWKTRLIWPVASVLALAVPSYGLADSTEVKTELYEAHPVIAMLHNIGLLEAKLKFYGGLAEGALKIGDTAMAKDIARNGLKQLEVGLMPIDTSFVSNK